MLDFVAVFGFAFIEPQMVFYLYNTLAFSTAQFGLMVSGYGLTMLFGKAALGQLGDRFGKRLLIAVGFLLNSSLYLGLLLVHQFGWLILVALVAGLGSSLVTPALSAFYLDITAQEHRSRIMGMKESVAALGGVAGPLLVALLSRWIPPQGIFALAGIVIVLAVILALVVLSPQPREARPRGRASNVCSSERAPAVVAAVRGITGAAAAVRASSSRTAVAVGTSAASPAKGEVVRW